MVQTSPITTMDHKAEFYNAVTELVCAFAPEERHKVLKSEESKDTVVLLYGDIGPVMLEMLEHEEGVRMSKAIAFATKNLPIGIAIGMLKCGMSSTTPFWELAPEISGMRLTPHGRKLAIKSIRSMVRATIAEEIHWPEDIKVQIDRVLKKTELALV